MKKLVIIAGVILLFGSCYNDKYEELYPNPTAVTCDTTMVTYAADVAPIIVAKCNIAGGCHDAVGAAVSGYDFTEYAGLHAIATPEILLGDINWAPTSSAYSNMPKDHPKLPQCEIDKITRWVHLGALNN
jgi:hypothetical protein